MALGLHFEDDRAFIDYHEEELFVVASESGNCKRLCWLFENFYSSPKIPYEFANEIVHELIAVSVLVQNDPQRKYLTQTILRLLPFFSKAYVHKEQINCISD